MRPHPEGYRKAMQKMKLAEKFGLPIVTFIDTPGAYPGLKAEERGQAEAIAVNLRDMSRLKTPIVSIVIGEGGSGGALGIGVADRVAMMENAWYSVISPEGCAAILWKVANDETNNQAANALALTAKHNMANGLIDGVVKEPLGGAHRDPAMAAEHLQRYIIDTLQGAEPLQSTLSGGAPIRQIPPHRLLQRRGHRQLRPPPLALTIRIVIHTIAGLGTGWQVHFRNCLLSKML